MIKFQNMVIKNFMSVGHAEIDLADQGLILIEGVNEDDPSAMSNGSGKSSIVDAISWCLYGETARGSAGDSIINVKAGKGTRVSVWLEVDGEMYVIQRGRKHPIFKNRVELEKITLGSSVVLTGGTDKLTQEKINHLLGCTVDVFNAAIYMGQEAMPDLPGMTDKRLKNILEQALSLDKLDEALEVCKARVDSVSYNLGKAKDSLEKTKSKLYDGQRVLDRLLALRKTLSKELEDAQALYVKEVNAFKRDKIALEANILRFENKLNDLKAEIKPENPEYALKIEEMDLDFVKKEQGLNQIEKDIRGEEWVLNKSKDQLKEFSEGKNCPTCGKPCDSTDDLNAKVDALKEEINTSKEILTAMRSKFKLAERDLGQARADKQRYLKMVQEKSAENNAKIADKDTVVKDIVWEKHNLAQKTDGFKKLIGVIQMGVDSKTKAFESASDEMIEMAQAIKRYEVEIARLQLEENKYQKQLDDLNKVAHILGRKGFRGEVLDQITPFLNLRTNHYLSQLSNDNMSATWDTIAQNSAGDFVESFHITVRHANGIDKFALLSGGEKRKVRLACALALQDLISSRAIKPIKLFIADEIDDAIDGAGLELLMSVLEQKAKEVGTVMIISHNDISDWVRNKITIVKKDGQATFKSHADPT